MAKMQEFKCPCCGGSIEFDSSVQKMKCPFCDTEFDVGTLSEYAQTVEEEQPEDMSWSDEAGSEWQDGESEGLRTYVCKSCGGEIVGDANTAATACPFCGSPVVMTGQLSGALKPDYVIPFKKSKKEAPTVIVSACKILYSFFSGKIIPVFICSIVQTCKLFYCKIFQWIFFIYHNSYSIFSNDFCFQKLCFIIL